MSDLKELKISHEHLKALPLGYNKIKYNDLTIPKSDESYLIKMNYYNSKTTGIRATKPISKIIDLEPINSELKKHDAT